MRGKKDEAKVEVHRWLVTVHSTATTILTPFAADFRGDTAHPILYIGNMADNVTPLQSSFNNSAKFRSSVVLKQNSYGVSLPLAYSLLHILTSPT
jgi:hypothetical protein